jgi:3-phosphoshikimate 1-carboxyvinyltransferase
MQRRPIQPLVDAWRQLGVDVEATRGCPPVRVRGDRPRGGRVQLDPSVSSQFLSSLLLVGAHLRGGIEVAFTAPLASREYAALTCTLLERFGIDAELRADGAKVIEGAGRAPTTIEAGGDWSAMGVWTCLNHLTGSRVRASNLRQASGQADERLGDALTLLAGPGDRTIDVASMPDQFLNLAVVAALRRGATRLEGAHNTRRKESDRVAVAAGELRRLGADLDELADGLLVRGGGPLRGAVIEAHGDHRVAMAMALAGCIVPGVVIDDPDCTAKSYPDFWRDLGEVRTRHRAVAIVGNRGAGKTTLARALAQRTGSTFVDSDDLFTADHGPIAPFVAEHGWPAFRRLEERLVAQALLPGRIAALGGGAIESERTRSLLRDRAFVLWLDAGIDLLRERLASGAERPSVTGRPVLDELPDLIATRTPHYAELCHRRVDASLPAPQQIEAALRAAW